MSISSRKGKQGGVFKHDSVFMRKAVQDYLDGTRTIKQVAVHYRLVPSTLHNWIHRYHNGLEPFDSVTLPSMSTELSDTDLKDLQKQNEALQKKLQEANMKITGLEIMIDIAEEQLGVDIRKKSGARQSEDCASTTPKSA